MKNLKIARTLVVLTALTACNFAWANSKAKTLRCTSQNAEGKVSEIFQSSDQIYGSVIWGLGLADANEAKQIRVVAKMQPAVGDFNNDFVGHLVTVRAATGGYQGAPELNVVTASSLDQVAELSISDLNGNSYLIRCGFKN